MTSVTMDARLRNSCVLAIEPDPSHRRWLNTVLDSRLRGSLHIVDTAEAAVQSIERQLPDLVLTSSLLNPIEVRAITAHLKTRPDAIDVPILITPQIEEPLAAPSRRFWRRRPETARGVSQTDVFLQQLDQYLDHARAARAARAVAAMESTSEDRSALRIVPPRSDVLAAGVGRGRVTALRSSDRRRAARSPQDQLPWLHLARLPWGSDLQLVDVSRGGVLVETTSRMTPGTLVDLEFVGNDLSTTVPSRILRTTVAHVDRLGVRYRAAAAFTRDLDLLEPGVAAERLLEPKAIGEILVRTLADAGTGGTPAAMRARFEREVQRLVPVCTVRIQPAPTPGPHASDSIYFTVPSAAASAVLQATFDRSRPPSAMEFKVLKSSAYLAAVLLDFAPFDQHGVLRALA